MGSVRRWYQFVVFLSIGILLLGYTNCSKVEFQNAKVQEISSKLGAGPKVASEPRVLASQNIIYRQQSLQTRSDREDREFVINSSVGSVVSKINSVIATQVTVSTLQAQINQIIQSYGPADLVITMDNSGSMTDDIASLRTELNNFIENLASEVDLRLVIAHGELESPVKVRAFHCLSNDSMVSQAEIDGAKDFINNVPLNVHNESPVQVGIHVFKNKPSCLRANVSNFLFVMSDEDERENGSAGSASLSTATVNQINADLMSLGIRLYAGINSSHGNASYDGHYIASFSQGTGGKSYQLGNGLGSNLQSFSADLLNVVKNYVISDKDIAPTLIRGTIGNDNLTLGSDFTLNQRTVAFTDAITQRIENGDAVNFEFMVKEDLQIDFAMPEGFTPSVYLDNVKSDNCASIAAQVAEIQGCMSLNHLGMNPTIKVIAEPKSLALPAVPGGAESVLSVKLNGVEVTPLSIFEDQGMLFLQASGLEFGLSDELQVRYKSIKNTIVGISQIEEMQVESIIVNEQIVSPSCVEWSGDDFSVDNCVGAQETVDSIRVKVSVGDSSKFSVLGPQVPVIGPLVYDNIDSSQMILKYNAGQISFSEVAVEIPEAVEVRFLEASSLSISLNRRPLDEERVTVTRNGELVPDTMFTVRRIEPVAVLINEFYKINDGDIIEVIAQK